MDGTTLLSMGVMSGMDSAMSSFGSYFGTMTGTEWLVLGMQFLLILAIGYDAGHRKWLSKGQFYLMMILVVFLPLIGAVVYLVVVIFTEAQMPECPDCNMPLSGDLRHCDRCGYDVEEKMKRKEIEQKDEFDCDKCEKRFETFRGLLEHKSKTHSSSAEEEDSEESEKPKKAKDDESKCEECGKTFSGSRGLKVHKSMKHED